MKLFKIILILILLFSISFGVCGQPTTLELDTSITDTEVIIPSWISTRTDNSRIRQFEDGINNLDTLLEWFKSLSLDEKVKLYNGWKNEDGNK